MSEQDVLRDRLAQADALIDWVIEAFTSYQPATLALWEANWLAKARTYREAVTRD